MMINWDGFSSAAMDDESSIKQLVAAVAESFWWICVLKQYI